MIYYCIDRYHIAFIDIMPLICDSDCESLFGFLSFLCSLSWASTAADVFVADDSAFVFSIAPETVKFRRLAYTDKAVSAITLTSMYRFAASACMTVSLTPTTLCFPFHLHIHQPVFSFIAADKHLVVAGSRKNQTDFLCELRHKYEAQWKS